MAQSPVDTQMLVSQGTITKANMQKIFPTFIRKSVYYHAHV